MEPYKPTTEEERALFVIDANLFDAISINNKYFFDEETTEIERDLIFNATKEVYKSCLSIYENISLLPFC